MFVIFGVGHEKIEEKIDLSASNCSNCNNQRNWIRKKKTLWFSLFFIPLFPIRTSYSHQCPVCNYGYEISKQKWE